MPVQARCGFWACIAGLKSLKRALLSVIRMWCVYVASVMALPFMRVLLPDNPVNRNLITVL